MLQKLITDIKRPMGGWTFGILTILTAMIVLFASGIGYWPDPQWTAMVAAVCLMVAHMMWGAAGYYPRRF